MIDTAGTALSIPLSLNYFFHGRSSVPLCKKLVVNLIIKSYIIPASHPLSNIQQELLKLYSSDIEDADLLNIKTWLAKYFADKAISEADTIWQEKGYINETMDQWLNEDKSHYGCESGN